MNEKLLLSAKHNDKEHLNTRKKVLMHLLLPNKCVFSSHLLFLCHCSGVEGTWQNTLNTGSL